MELISPEEFAAETDLDTTPEVYQDFRDAEGVPVHTKVYVEDANDLEVGHWDRTGQRGAFVNLYGMEGVNDIQIQELEPGGETTPQRHLYDEIAYVSEGAGFTRLGPEDGEDSITFEWEKNSCFLLPRNVPYTHVNSSGEETARIVSNTALPQLLELIRDFEFVFDGPYDPAPVSAGFYSEGYYADDFDVSVREGREHGHQANVVWDTNFIPDLTSFEDLRTTNANVWGAGRFAHIPFFHSTLGMHIAEYPSGMYKKAHRHAPGFNIYILDGDGYLLMWRPDWEEKRIKIDYGPDSIVTPPGGWSHNHFHTDVDVTQMFAWHPPELGTLMDGESVFNPQGTYNNIEYVDEDPDVRALYEAALDEKGLEFRMPEAAYEDPDFDLEAYLDDKQVFA